MPTPTPGLTTTSESNDAIGHRVDAIMNKLLDAIERDVDAGGGALPGPHVAAYEALCRAECSRKGL